VRNITVRFLPLCLLLHRVLLPLTLPTLSQVRNVVLKSGFFINCVGLSDSPIYDVVRCLPLCLFLQVVCSYHYH
jgi:hypothetical protein